MLFSANHSIRIPGWKYKPDWLWLWFSVPDHGFTVKGIEGSGGVYLSLASGTA